MLRCKDGARSGTPLRALDLTGDDLKRLRGFQFLSAKPLLVVINLDEARRRRVSASDVERAAEATGLDGVPVARGDTGGRRSARRSSSRSRSSTRPTPRRSSPTSGCTSRGSIASSAPATICSATCRSSPSARTSAAPGRSRAEPPRSSPPARSTATSRAASSAPRSSPTMRSSRADRWPPAASTAKCGSRARNTSSRTATSSISVRHLVAMAGRVAACGTRAPGRATCNRLVQSRQSTHVMIRTIVVCEAQVPFVHGGAEMHVRSAGRAAAGARLRDRARVAAVQVVSQGGDPRARRGVAPARSERGNGRADRSRHRDEVSRLLRPAPAQGDVADAPVPRGVRAVRHGVQRLRARRAATSRSGATWSRSIREMLGESHRLFATPRTPASASQKYNGLSAEPLYHPPLLAERLRKRSPRRLRPRGQPPRERSSASISSSRP